MRYLAAACLFASSAALAGPVDFDRVPAGSRIVAHIDMERLLDSRIGSTLMEHLEDHGIDGLQEIKAHLGLDPFEVVRDVTVCLLGDSEEDAVAIVSMTSDAERLVSTLEAFSEETGYRQRRVGGRSLHTFNVDDDVFGCCAEIRGGWVLAVGQRERTLRNAVDTIWGDGESLEDDHADVIEYGPGRGSIIWVGAADLADLPIDDLDGPANLLKKVDAFVADIGERGDDMSIRVRVRAKKGEDAARLGQMAQGLIAMSAFAGEFIDEHDHEARAAISLLQSVRVSSEDNWVSAELKIDLDQVMRLVGEID
ncbi:MAG: hypothetical protein H6811_03975 [Phycisphaeraceae bacterium]|nr:hypothetical protein [Phycisphaeraceae bacterium]